MSVRFYVDVHVPLAITEQLRMRGVDVLTAQTDNATRLRRRSGIDWESEQSRGLVWEGGIPSALSRRINSLVLPITDKIPQVFI